MLILDNVRVFPRRGDEPLARLTISDGRIAAVEPAGEGESRPDAQRIDCHAMVALPALGDVHAHLDSNRFDLPFRPHTSDGTLEGLINNDVANWPKAEAPIEWRCENALRRIILSGATRVRSHAQVDPISGLRRVEAVLAARAKFRDRVQMQVVAFPQLGIIRPDGRGSLELMKEAIAAGADLVGGIDPCGLERDPVAHLDAVFGLAEATGCGIDLHLHERGELGAFTMELIAERVRAHAMQSRVTISHAFALIGQPRLIELCAREDIGITTVAPPNAALPIHRLRAAGVRVGLGQDGMRDYWSPYGNGDTVERVWQAAFVADERRDQQIEELWRVASYGAASILEERDYPVGRAVLQVGDEAEIVLIPGESVTQVVMDRPSARAVIHRGRLSVWDSQLVER